MRHAMEWKWSIFSPVGFAKLMPGRKIENVVVLGNTEIFEERKHMAFLLLLRPTYMQIRANLIFQVLPDYI